MLALVACDSNLKKIATAYFSPRQYQGFECNQLQDESTRVQSRVTELAGALDKKASDNSAEMGVGLVLFWPALFFLDGDGPQATSRRSRPRVLH